MKNLTSSAGTFTEYEMIKDRIQIAKNERMEFCNYYDAELSKNTLKKLMEDGYTVCISFSHGDIVTRIHW